MNALKTLILAAAMLFLPAAAHAQPAYTAGAVSLHAGPGTDYPVVALLDGGLAVNVQGCTPDYGWCDVVAGGYRGWLYARDIRYVYQGALVPLIDYGAAIGIGVVTFVIGHYWQQHYVGRPWYRHLPHWSHRPPHADFHPRPPHAAHPAPWPQPAPAFRPADRPAIAQVHPRPQQAGPRERKEHGAAPGPRPLSRSSDAGPPPRREHGGAHPGNHQRQTAGPGRGARFR